MKAKFYWAVIGDANPEPVSVVECDGKRVAYTLGCGDPFELDVPDANIELLGILTPPLKPAEMEAARLEREKRLSEETARGVVHSWQRWNP